MRVITRSWIAATVFAVATASLPAPALAQSHGVIADDATRYLALGDSIASGYKAVPVTDGYPYRARAS